MASFNIDGLTYTDKLPHSRIERILYNILKKQGSGGGGDDPEPTADLVVDDPNDLGTGLKLVNDEIRLDIVDDMDGSDKLITSNAVSKQLEMVDTIMASI